MVDGEGGSLVECKMISSKRCVYQRHSETDLVSVEAFKNHHLTSMGVLC